MLTDYFCFIIKKIVMAEKHIQIVKANGKVSFAPYSTGLLANINRQEGLKPAHLQAKTSIVSDEERKAFEDSKLVLHPDFIPADKAGQIISEKDARIAELEKQLAAQGGGKVDDSKDASTATGDKLSKDGNATDAIEHLKTLSTAEEVEAYTAGEERKGVLNAKTAKLTELAAN